MEEMQYPFFKTWYYRPVKKPHNQEKAGADLCSSSSNNKHYLVSMSLSLIGCTLQIYRAWLQNFSRSMSLVP